MLQDPWVASHECYQLCHRGNYNDIGYFCCLQRLFQQIELYNINMDWQEIAMPQHPTVVQKNIAISCSELFVSRNSNLTESIHGIFNLTFTAFKNFWDFKITRIDSQHFLCGWYFVSFVSAYYSFVLFEWCIYLLVTVMTQPIFKVLSHSNIISQIT